MADIIVDTSIKAGTGEYLPFHLWTGVTCDNNGSITHIDWHYSPMFHMDGFINLDFLPHSLLKFNITQEMLHGTLHTEKLPDLIEIFFISWNKIEGCVELNSLPSSIVALKARNNLLHGTLSFREIPSSLRHINLCENSLSGLLDISSVPSSLEELWLANNKFDCEILNKDVPPSLRTLNLLGNNIRGLKAAKGHPGMGCGILVE